jgi:hypothetical protein
VAQLNLLLKALVEKTLLPTLQQNLKHGNSLIFGEPIELQDIFGADIYDNKPFNYAKEMPGAFNSGGFDLIIGNPPYIRHEEIKHLKPQLEKDFVEKILTIFEKFSS